MDYKEIKRQQEEILACLAKPHVTIPREVPSSTLLSRILSYPADDVVLALGGLGLPLLRFANEIDIHHPGLFSLFGGELVSDDEKSFNVLASDILKLVSYSTNVNLSEQLKTNLSTLARRHPAWPRLRKGIDAPSRTNQFTRFVPDKKRRASLRREVNVQRVELRSVRYKGVEYWENQPDNFSNFYRHIDPYSNDIKIAVEKYEHFKRMRLNMMAKEIQKTLNRIRDLSDKNTYLGFHRISQVQVGAILAKMIGFEYVEAIYRLRGRANHFNYNFLPGDMNSAWTDCDIRSYPLSDLMNDTSKSVRDVVEQLDAMPELDGRAAFDQFRVLVVNFCVDGIPPYEVKVDGQVRFYAELDNANRCLDLTFLRNEFIPAVLVGVKDNESYFICYWM